MSGSLLDGKRILAVDDEPDVLSVLEEEIRSACKNCTIEKATRYEQAADLLKTNSYDLVILDILLPDLNGCELLKTMRSRNVTTPVVCLTAKGEQEDIVPGLELGAMPSTALTPYRPSLHWAQR